MPKSHPLLTDAVWLHEQYITNGRTTEEIGVDIGRTSAAVWHALRRNGIPLRTAGETRALRGTKKRRTFWQLGDKAWLEEHYYNRWMNLPEIATIVGCSSSAVQHAMRDHGIQRRRSGLIRPGHRRSDATPQLYDEAWLRHQRAVLRRSVADIAAEVGTGTGAVRRRLERLHIRVKDPLPRGEAFKTAAPRYQRTSTGYRNVWAPDHPAANQKGWVPEHRLVAEQALGRLLRAGEVVHHLNETPLDNRPENFLIFPSNGAHMAFHANPPEWIPRCKCCGKPNPEVLSGRPPEIPLLYRP